MSAYKTEYYRDNIGTVWEIIIRNEPKAYIFNRKLNGSKRDYIYRTVRDFEVLAEGFTKIESIWLPGLPTSMKKVEDREFIELLYK